MRNFLYYILKKDGRSGKVVNKVVTYSGQPFPLPQTPDGWQDVVLSWERSLEKHSIANLFSLPLDYVRDGMHIIREALYNRTVQESIYLLIQRLTLEITDTTYKWVYKFFYKGKFDLTDLEDKQDSVEVPVVQGDLQKLLETNYGKDYNFPMNDPDIAYVRMDGVEIENLILAIIDNGSSMDGDFYFKNHILGLNLITAEVGFIGAAKETERTQVHNGNSDIRATTQYFLKSTLDRDIEISFNFDFTMEYTPPAPGVNPAAVFKIVIRRIDESNISDFQEEIFVRTAADGFNGTFHVEDTVTFNVRNKDELYLYAFCNIEGVSGDDQIRINYFITDQTLFKIKFNYRHPTSYIKCFTRSKMWKMLGKAAFGSENNVKSDLCDLYNNLVLTCGDAIREVPNPVLKTNVRDFFDDTDSTLMAGIDIQDDKVEIEDRLKYYDTSEEYDLGQIKNFVKKPAKELLCNTFRFGHPKQETENLNGKYDPNGNNVYEGPLTVITKEYKMVSPYKAGPYEIESLRIRLQDQTTTDDKTDSQVFVLAVKGESTEVYDTSFFTAFSGFIVTDPRRFRTGQQIKITGSTSNDGVYDVSGIQGFLLGSIIFVVQPVVDEIANITVEWLSGIIYELDRPAYTTLESVPESIFNLPYLTPKTMALRHLRWVSSINYGLQKLKFLNGKENFNTDLKTELGGIIIDEDRDEDFNEVMWLPYWFIFDKDVPIDLPEILETKRNKLFKFTDENGDEWKGFLWVAGIAPNNFTPQSFRLLAAPGNDITKLIHG